jgi:hypothetical protein
MSSYYTSSLSRYYWELGTVTYSTSTKQGKGVKRILAGPNAREGSGEQKGGKNWKRASITCSHLPKEKGIGTVSNYSGLLNNSKGLSKIKGSY